MSLGSTIANIAMNVGRVISQHAPEILMVAGTTAVVGGTVVTAVQTTKLDEELYDIRCKQEELKRNKDEFHPQDYKKELFQIKKAAALRVAKIYSWSAILIGGGVICFFGAYGIMRRRQALLVASLAAAEKAFEEYRARVIADVGEEKDLEYYYGLKKTQIEEQVTDDKGKTKTVTKDVYEADKPMVSRYAILLTPEFSSEASDDVTTNKNMLISMQNYWNSVLPSRKKVFLNEIYHELGIDETWESRQVGWNYDADIHGDGKIKFRTIDIMVRDDNDPYGYRNAVIVDFNVDGDIAHTLPKNPQLLGMEVEDHIMKAERICECA